MSTENSAYEQQIKRLDELERVFRGRAGAARTRVAQLKARGDVLKARDYERLAAAWKLAADDLSKATCPF
jgi:phage shock protein A